MSVFKYIHIDSYRLSFFQLRQNTQRRIKLKFRFYIYTQVIDAFI